MSNVELKIMVTSVEPVTPCQPNTLFLFKAVGATEGILFKSNLDGSSVVPFGGGGDE